MKCNFKLIVSYDGTRYLGWEHQPNTEMTIQGKLEKVLNRMLQEDSGEADRASAAAAGERTVEAGRMEGRNGAVTEGESASAAAAGERTAEAGRIGGTAGKRAAAEGGGVTVIGAGRTDAGVHARAMTANVLLDTDRTPLEIQQYMNRYLPDDISVNDVSRAADRFHSRYHAAGKTYRYTLWYAEDGSGPVFDRRYVMVLRNGSVPDTERMREAASRLVGEHDFRSFCGNSHMKKSTVRTVDSIRIEESGHYIRIYYHGNGFLQNMVRILSGTLLECGYGRLEPEDMERILEARDRTQAGPTLPPQGLCLMKVDY